MLKKIILDKRLGQACLEASIIDLSTQDNEAFNRILSKNIPKTSTHPVNFKARTHATVLLHNLGLSACSIKLLAAAGHKVSEEIK